MKNVLLTSVTNLYNDFVVWTIRFYFNMLNALFSGKFIFRRSILFDDNIKSFQ